MSVAPADQINVDVAGTFVCEGFEEFLDQRERKIFMDQQHFAIDWDVENEIGPPREIDDHARQRFVERAVGVAETTNAGFVAERLSESLGDAKADAFAGGEI